jgi:hypothetical protein
MTERRIAIISMIVGVFWLASSISFLIFGLSMVGNIEHTVLSPVNIVHNTVVQAIDVARGIDFLDVVEKPLQDLKSAILSPLQDLTNDIKDGFTKIKLVLVVVLIWLAIPQVFLIYAGWLLRKGKMKGRK